MVHQPNMPEFNTAEQTTQWLLVIQLPVVKLSGLMQMKLSLSKEKLNITILLQD